MPLFTYLSNHEQVTLSYEIHGNGVNKLMMISGMNTNGSIWKYMIPYLKDVTICTFDHRGTGYSSSPKNYSIDIFAEDTIALSDHLKWEKFNICGISMGGFTCLKVIQKIPDRVISQTLISTAMQGRGVPTWTAIVLLWIANIVALFSTALRSYAIAPLLYPFIHLRQRRQDGVLNYTYAVEKLNEDFTSRPAPPLRSVVGHIMSALLFKLNTKEIVAIAKLNIPSIVIAGDSDILIRPYFTCKMATVLGYPLYSLHNVGHAPISQVPEKTSQLMNELVNKK
jgi:pimeloyl-ACP methyl ester carboxylesterase